MRHPVTLLVMTLLALPLARATQATRKPPTPETLPQFLTDVERDLIPLEAAYGELEYDPLPFFDENGEPLGHRPIEDRRKALANLRQTLHKLSDAPRDLPLALQLFFQIEDLSDDLYDLGQVAYDNDREELGRQLSKLVTKLDLDRSQIEDYVLTLADTTQGRIQELEKRNQELEQALKAPAKK